MAYAWGQLDASGCKEYRLHRGQTDVMESKARFVAAVAGTGGGKTVIGPLWIADQIKRVVRKRGHRLSDAPVRGMVIAPTYPVMARATSPTLVSTFAGTDLEGRFVPSQNRYYLPDGMGVLWLLSADSPGSLEGGQFDFAWIDEGGQISLDAWIAIQGRLGVEKGRCLITTTPYGQNWLYHRFFLFAQRGDRTYYVRQWPSVSNPAYPQDEYERAKRSMSAQRAAMRYDGLFVKLSGLVYPDFESCIKQFDPKMVEGFSHGGIDFGWNDPFAAEAGTIHRNGKFYVWYERYRRFVNIGDHAPALPRGVLWHADASRPDSINELVKGDHTVRKNEVPDILLGVDAVNARIYSDTLVVHPSCRALRAEAKEYQYPEKDDESVGEKPVGGFDHALDALRYMIVNMDRGTMAASEEAA